MHWRMVSNTHPRLADLAMDNVLEANPWISIEDSYGDDYDELDLCFGSMGVTIRLGVFDGQAETAYMHGACMSMAFALAEALDKDNPQFMVVTVPNDFNSWSGHVALMVDENTVIDFYGVRPVEQMLRAYPTREPVEIMDADMLKDRLVDKDYRDDPLAYLCELERLVTEHFAQAILDRDAKALAA